MRKRKREYFTEQNIETLNLFLQNYGFAPYEASQEYDFNQKNNDG